MHVESVILDNFWLWTAALILCLPIRRHAEKAGEKFAEKVPYVGDYSVQFVHALVSVVILVICVALLIGATNNAFIYTRF